MRRSLLSGVALGVLGMFVAGAPALADPPADRVRIWEPEVTEIDCGGETITRTVDGWLRLPADVEHLDRYHLARVYSNDEGATWRYTDTGIIRFYERDGVAYVSLSGRSINVGPEGTGWVGHWVLNEATQAVDRSGRGVGDVDQLACDRLVG